MSETNETIFRLGASEICLLQGDITLETVDCIVNAANSRLAGGGGVDGAVHRRGGPKIMSQTRLEFPNGCATGDAVISGAGALSARFVIHAVGPIWQGGQQGEPELLAGAYRACLQLARDHDCRSIAFPALSAGAYGYPAALAAEIALATVREFVTKTSDPHLVRFALFTREMFEQFHRTAIELFRS